MVALVLAVVMAMPMTVIASAIDEAQLRVEDGVVFVPLRPVVYALDGAVVWNGADRSAVITRIDGYVITVPIEAVGGFVEHGVAWVPMEFVYDVLIDLLYVAQVEERVERIDLNLWEQYRFEDVREPMFSTDLSPGVIAVGYIEYMSDNLGARSAFTYSELDAAVWIVEELLAMGHDWDNIAVQEFTYWQVNDMELGLFGHLNWGQVTSPMILGVGREYQLRADRVSQNVVLTIPGQSQRKIVVGAHYDSPPYPSASDNASGTALLMESAQRMMELEHYYTIVYVFFGAEEVGLIGAYYYLESLTARERNNIVMMVNADVLIEGPYLIYGAGSAPEITEELIADLVEMFLYELMDLIVAQYEAVQAQIAGMDIEAARLIFPYESFDELLESLAANLANEPMMLLLEASMMGLVEPVINAVAQQVTDIAAELSGQYDFEFISIPDAIGFSSDNLAFLFGGHTVVNFVGLERAENITPELAAQLFSHGAALGEFAVTILHSPLDEFNAIENLWPGMMNANLEAFIIFLEAILTGSFS